MMIRTSHGLLPISQLWINPSRAVSNGWVFLTAATGNQSIHFPVSLLPLRRAVAGEEEIPHSYLPSEPSLVDRHLVAVNLLENKFTQLQRILHTVSFTSPSTMARNVGMAEILYLAAIACCLSTSTRRNWTCGNDAASSAYLGAMAFTRTVIYRQLQGTLENWARTLHVSENSNLHHNSLYYDIMP